MPPHVTPQCFAIVEASKTELTLVSLHTLSLSLSIYIFCICFSLYRANEYFVYLSR
ncbi:hypothetical protein LguiA_015470 [Lonicera macranthoides]